MSLTDLVSGLWNKVKSSVKTTLAVAPLVAMCYAGSAKADDITFSNIVSGELLTSSHPALYNGYRQGDAGVTNNWYRWVMKVEKTGPDLGNSEFKIDVPNDFASTFNDTGLMIKNQSGSDVSVWGDSGNSINTGDGFIRLDWLRMIDIPNTSLASNNYLTIEYLSRVGSNNLVTAVRTNGFWVPNFYNCFSGPYNNMITNSLATPVPYSALPSFTISISNNPNGSITSSNSTVKLAEDAKFNIAASNHYTIASISTNGSSIGSIPSGATNYVFVWSNVVANGNISADFIIDSNKVNVVTNGNGIIAPGSLYLPFGGSTNFVLTADIGNHISDIKTNNASIGGSFGDQSRTFSWTNDLPNRTNEFTLEAVFQINSNLVTASAGPNGTIVPAGSLYLPYGSSTNFVITPDEHYDVNVKSNGTSLGAITLFSWTNNFTNQANSLTLEALFSPKAYPVTLITPTNGTFNPATDFQAYYGTTTGVTVAANAGYHIKDIFTNNASIGGTFGPGVTNYNLSWTMGTNALIQALFALNPPTLNSTNIQFEALVNQIKTWWTPGDGSNRLVVAGTNNINWSPVDGLEYIATNPAGLFFDNKVVYNGSGTNFTLLGLATNTMYYFKIFEYNGAGSETIYLTNGIPAEANKSTLPASDLPRGTIFTFH